MNFVLLVVSIIEHDYQSFLSSNENAFLYGYIIISDESEPSRLEP
jgi:hypothetical protein